MNSCIQFGDEITDFDYQGQYISIACKDKTLKVYDILTVNEKEMKNYYKQFKFDYPSAVAMSPDCSLIAVGLHKHINIQIYSFDPKNVDKKYFNLMYEFPFDSHSEPISNMQIQLGNKYLTTFASDKDTDIKIWDMKAKEVISKRHTGLLEHHHCYFSTNMCSVSGFASNCFVYKYKEDKVHHKDEELKKIISLPHDKNLVFSSLSNNEQRAFTISADHCLKIWSLDVMYHLQEDAKLLKEFRIEDGKQLFKNPEQFEGFNAIHGAYNENSKKWLIAVASSNSVVLLNNKYEKLEELTDIVSENCQIDDIRIITIKNAYALLVLSKSEERISIFKINSFLK